MAGWEERRKLNVETTWGREKGDGGGESATLGRR